MSEPERFRTNEKTWLTWGNLLWIVIALMVILTIVVMMWASKQPAIHDEPGPPLSSLPQVTSLTEII